MSTIIQKRKFKGLFTRYPETKNPIDTALVAYNVKITGEGIEPIKGFSLFGQVGSVAGEKIIDAYTFVLQDGSEIPIRIRQTSSENILEWYDEDNDEWYILLDGMTAGAITSFQDFNTSQVNALYFGNGEESYSEWTGNITNLTAALTGGETDILVLSTTGFPATGTIIYNGTEIAYTSKTATKFVVASAHASSSDDDGVAEAVDDTTHAAVALSEIMLSLQNRMYLVDADDPNSLEYSVEGDAEDWSAGANRADAGIEDFPIMGGKITALIGKDQYVFIMKNRTIILFEWKYPTSTTKTPSYKHIVTAANIGAINHKGVSNIYNEILYATKTGIRSLTQDLISGNWNADPISEAIRPTIKNYDFSDAVSVYYEKEDVFLVACKSDEDQENNNKVIAIWYYTNEQGERRRGFSVFDWTVGAWFIFGSELYFGSSMEGTVYKAFDGRTRDGATIRSIYTDNRNDFGSKQIKEAEHYKIMGLIAPGTELKIRLYFDGGRFSSQQFTIRADGDYVGSVALKTLGAYKIGEEVLGGILADVKDMRIFDVDIEIPRQNFYDIQVERICETLGGSYKIFFEGIVNPREGFDIPQDTFN